jgi:hypothetical protein
MANNTITATVTSITIVVIAARVFLVHNVLAHFLED